MGGDYFGYDGPFPPFNDSLVHHYVFTLYALDLARAAGRGPLHRRRGARGAGRPRAGRGHALRHLHAEPAPGGLTLDWKPPASSRSATARPPGTSTPASRATLDIPLNDNGRVAGAPAGAQALAGEELAAVYASDLCARTKPRRHGATAGVAVVHRRRPARARLRRLRGPHLRRDRGTAGPSRRSAGASATPSSRAAGGETLRAFYARSVATATRAGRAPPGPGDRARGARRRDGLPLPRRHAPPLDAPRTLAARQRRHQPLLYTPQGFTLVGWSDTHHLERAALDEV